MLAGYVRVSTDDQSPMLQIESLKTYAKLKGEEVTFFIDEGFTGRNTNRPKFQEMMERLSEFSAVMVWKLDRIGRNASHLLEILATLQKADVDFISATQGLDTTTAGGKMLFTIMAAVAEFESALISERVKEGMAVRKKQGAIFGAKKKYDHDEVRRLYGEGVCVRDIADSQRYRDDEGNLVTMSLRQAKRIVGV